MALLDGLIGTGAWGDDDRPRNWRQAILLLFPNGQAPLTAVMSKLKSEVTSDPYFIWFEKKISNQRAEVGVTIAAGETPGTEKTITLEATPAAANGHVAATSPAKIFKKGHIIMDEANQELLMVTSAGTKDGEADELTIKAKIGVGRYSGTCLAITDGDVLTVVGSAYSEGASVGTALSETPTAKANFTQIFRTPLFVTRTGRKTRLRYDTSGPYREAKREALSMHSIEMEKAFIFGKRDSNGQDITAGLGVETGTPNTSGALDIISGVDAAGQMKRATGGVLSFLSTNHPDNDTDFDFSAGVTEAAFDLALEKLFSFGSPEKLALCGNRALNILTQMAKNKATINVVPGNETYGMKMMEYITPFGTLYLKTHPLFSENNAFTGYMLALDLDKLIYRYIDDTQFLKNRQTPGDDASKDEFLTECGLEVHHEECHAWFKGLTSYVG